jgi:MFS family permease
MLAASAVLLAAFAAVERRSPAPLASPAVLARPTVKWGNLGGLILFSMSSAVIYLMTLYLQDSLGFSPLVTGLAFAVPGVAAITAGILAPRFIRRFGTRATLTAGIAVQGASFAPLLALGPQQAWVFLVIAAVGVSLFANVTGVVTYTVTATSGLPAGEQGLATGLTTMTQLVAITLGIPVIGAIAGSALAATAAPGGAALGGLHHGLAADAAINAIFAVVVWAGLRHAPRAAAAPLKAVRDETGTPRQAA